MAVQYQQRKVCRSCNASLKTLIHFGEFPIADKILALPVITSNEIAPLSLCICEQCKLLQIAEDISPEYLFKYDYPYYSSQNPALIKHFSTSANNLIQQLHLTKDSWVVEIACNDGVMMETFIKNNIPTTGVDPAIDPINIAREKGYDVINEFFDYKLASEILSKYNKKADLILCNNVLAHVPDPNTLLKGIKLMLNDQGKVVIEVPYALELLTKNEFDTIFHQHYSYFSLISLNPLFKRNGLFINSVERIPIHGGSLRIYASHHEIYDMKFKSLLEKEIETGLNENLIYDNFINNIKVLKNKLTLLLKDLIAAGKTIAGFGAAGKATTLTHYMNIDKTILSYIADSNIHKQGKYFPGNMLPIVSPEIINSNPPDYILILAWNFSNEIIEQMRDYKNKGGKFIIPIPEPVII